MTVIVFAAITPKQLNIKAFRLEMLNELRKEGTVHKQALRKTVTTWENKPTFESKISVSKPRGGASVTTKPTGSEEAVNHWVWTDEGTPPHTITARNAPTLRFQSGYTPRTKVGKFTSGASRRFGAWRRPVVVHHPGTTSRNWSKDLSTSRQKPFQERMKSAMRRAANKAF